MSDDDLAAAEQLIRSGRIPLDDVRAYGAALRLFITEYDKRGAAIERVRAMCLDYMAAPEGGSWLDIDTLWPSDVLAALDGTDPP